MFSSSQNGDYRGGDSYFGRIWLNFVLQIIGARKIGFDPLHGLSFIRLTGTLAINSITIYSFTSIIESNILSLILVPVVGGVIFLGISLAFKSVKISELRQFMNQS